MEWILCKVAESSCLPTHNIVPHTSLHHHPCHKTMKKFENFEGTVISRITPQKLEIRTWFCNCPQYLCLFRIVVECSPSIHDTENVGSPKSTSFLSSFHIGSRLFLSSQFDDIHIHR